MLHRTIHSHEPAPLAERFVHALALSLLFVVVYGGTNCITGLRSNIGLCFAPWELRIPLVPAMLIPYMSLDLLFIAAFFVSDTRERLWTISLRLASAILLAACCYLVVPLRLGYPQTTAPGLGGTLLRFLQNASQFNLAPSLHIAIGTIVFVHVCPILGNPLMRIATAIWFALIAASTLLTHQHHIIDLPTGFALAAACAWLVPGAVKLKTLARFSTRPDIAARYGVAGVALALIAAIVGGWSWLMIWPAGSLLLIAGAYAGWISDVYRKRHGRLPWSTIIVLGPVLVGTSIWRRVRYGCFPQPTEIAPGVFVGHRLRRNEARRLLDRGITFALDLTAEVSETRCLLGIRYENIPLLDWCPITADQLGTAVGQIIAARARGEFVYVHCAMGVSRAACISAAYLLHTMSVTSVEQALDALQRHRDAIRVDERSRDSLQEWFERTVRCTPGDSLTAASLERPARRRPGRSSGRRRRARPAVSCSASSSRPSSGP